MAVETNWPEVRLADIVSIEHGWPFKSELCSEEHRGGPIVVNIGNFRYTGGFRFEETTIREYRGNYPKEFELSAGDILLVMTCQTAGGEILGIPARVPGDGRIYLHNQRLGKVVINRPDLVDPNYLYWLFLWREFNCELSLSASGTKILHTAPGRIEAFRFRLPSLSEQHEIAEVLGTLDDKIELNRRMNETLEAMARALFKSWFVDFLPVRAKIAARTQTGDPVRAKHALSKVEGAEGRPSTGSGQAIPGLPKDLADLFPDSFEDSEVGEIPKGWRVAPLPEVVDVNPPRVLRKGEVAPYLDMANMPTRGHSPDALVERPFGSGTRFMNGDTLVARITPCLENGKTAFVDFLQEGRVGWGSTEYIILRPKPPLPTEFAYCLARSEEFRDFAIQSMTGSSGRQRVPTESLSHFLVVAPSKDVAELFGLLIKPLFARASDATEESRTLAAMSDTLLPNLLSGELRIPAAAKLAEANA